MSWEFREILSGLKCGNPVISDLHFRPEFTTKRFKKNSPKNKIAQLELSPTTLTITGGRSFEFVSRRSTISLFELGSFLE